MKDLQNELNEAFRLLSAIPVAGDNVELMASAKEHLRKAYAMTEEKKNGG